MSAFVALVHLAMPAIGGNQAEARRGASAKAKTAKKEPKASKRSTKRTVRRTYSVRGNPETTRRVAIEQIVEKLPDLAAMLNLQAEIRVVDSITVESEALTGTTTPRAADVKVATTNAGAYQDSELDESEDTDKISSEDLEALDELPDDINSFYKEFTTYMAGLNGESNVTDNGVDKQIAMETIFDWLGTRYHFGGMGRSGIDCSAFTGMVYRSLEFKLPRTAAAQWDFGTEVALDDLQFGDLVFFHTRKAVYVSHVGIYLGNKMFAHASSRNGVTVSSLESDYYAKHLIGARRFDLTSSVANANGTVASQQ